MPQNLWTRKRPFVNWTTWAWNHCGCGKQSESALQEAIITHQPTESITVPGQIETQWAGILFWPGSEGGRENPSTQWASAICLTPGLLKLQARDKVDSANSRTCGRNSPGEPEAATCQQKEGPQRPSHLKRLFFFFFEWKAFVYKYVHL